tara:strand:- start:425 stop:1012 length:588 start_codon:yes stop_codon:yes gene_type:complete
MKPIYNFLIKPKNKRYDNIKKINDTELILNTDISDHKFISRQAIIYETPITNDSNLTRGTELYVHHNIFRRWYDIRGIERNSKSYFKDNLYFCEFDQIFLYKNNKDWKANDGYCFVAPLANEDDFSIEKEQSLIGIVKYIDNSNLLQIGDKVGFTPWSEYEFIINGEKLYRVMTKEISIKYEYKGKEKEYNPSWV